jgi:hypothetical protein
VRVPNVPVIIGFVSFCPRATTRVFTAEKVDRYRTPNAWIKGEKTNICVQILAQSLDFLQLCKLVECGLIIDWVGSRRVSTRLTSRICFMITCLLPLSSNFSVSTGDLNRLVLNRLECLWEKGRFPRTMECNSRLRFFLLLYFEGLYWYAGLKSFPQWSLAAFFN